MYIKLLFSGIKDTIGSLKYMPKLQGICKEGNLTSTHVTKVKIFMLECETCILTWRQGQIITQDSSLDCRVASRYGRQHRKNARSRCGKQTRGAYVAWLICHG